MKRFENLHNYTYFIYGFLATILIVQLNLFKYITSAEDATILFNYAENLWNTGRISFYPEGPIVEGYTDFLFMVLLAGTKFLCHDSFFIAKIISIASIFLSILLVFRSEDNKSYYPLLFVGFLLVFSPQLEAAWRGYGTWMWTFFLCLSTFSFLRKKQLLFFFSLFLCGLVRLDSLVMLFPLLAYSFLDSKNKGVFIKGFLLLFIYPFLLYLLFKWIYFGEILPLSFFITSNSSFDSRFLGFIYKNAFYTNYHFVKFYLFIPILTSLFIGLVGKSLLNIRQWIVVLSLMIIPFLFYSLFSQQMNLGFRYQMPMYLGFVYFFYFNFGKYRILISTLLSVLLVSYILYFSVPHIEKVIYSESNNHIKIAEEIATIDGNYKLLTTEAGIYPWKLKWHAIDAWGLNSKEFTQKLISENDIIEFNPDLVVAHCKIRQVLQGDAKTWNNMCSNLTNYLHCNKQFDGYKVFKNDDKDSFLIFWLKKEMKDYKEVEKILLRYNSQKIICTN
jgi:hypothetical protein